MKLFNRQLGVGERIEYMGWVHEGVVSAAQPWQTYRPKFLLLKGTDVMLFDQPPVSHDQTLTHKWISTGVIGQILHLHFDPP